MVLAKMHSCAVAAMLNDEIDARASNAYRGMILVVAANELNQAQGQFFAMVCNMTSARMVSLATCIEGFDADADGGDRPPTAREP